MTITRFIVTAGVASLVFGSLANGSRIVVHNDEWQTSDTGFAQAGSANATAYVQNVASFLNSGGGPGNFLVYSDNFSLNQTGFADAVTSAGHVLTIDSTGSTDMSILGNLLPFDGIFLAGFLSYDATVLANYVLAGGGVHLSLGTTSSSQTAPFWNPFLESFGITAAQNVNGVVGVVPMAGLHPVTAGVAQLYQVNGNSLSLTGGNPSAQIIETHAPTGAGLIAVFDGTVEPSEIPEPSSVTLVVFGLALFGALVVRKRHAVRDQGTEFPEGGA